jgi:Uncharacterized protein conserved in bacteria
LKNWIITGVLIALLVILSGSWYLYKNNMNVSDAAARTAAAKAAVHYQLQKTGSVTSYYGTQSYEVVSGSRNGVPMYVWVPDKPGKTASYLARPAKNGLTRSQALQKLAALRLDVRTILSVKLGAIQNQPVWEITFKNSRNSFNYVSFNFDTGKEVQRILNI